MEDQQDYLRSLPDLTASDIETLLAVLVSGKKRVQRVVLSKRTVWIKRYGTEKPTWWRHLQAFVSRLIPVDYLRPSPYLTPREMAEREQRRIRLFAASGIAAPQILYASRSAIVLTHVGETVQARLRKSDDDAVRDGLLVACAEELGRLHAAGLCHGRPYPRDMFFAGDRLGFMDFEEEPQSVMPLPVAQARDIWLLFLQIASTARRGTDTFDAAYNAWSARAPAAAIAELRRMTGFLGHFLSFARLIGRVRMGSDLRRFIVATSYLATVPSDSRSSTTHEERPQGRTP
ncbi:MULTISPECIES: BUD32 family EKC/KEOPS complex subunit [unclassified Rhizobium]|uniref:serine/threonine protein phosphatase n=1 Tax=unclassified Rhizobium TaxID=2613769 RepID=UPI001ADA0387|nr:MULTISPECIES: serine/threonine protein phosphatase [unclassified Rhizobium]MBO9096892.1 serine/threonine protein phosphatase [Rhizobium sp. L58/93]MBO9167131.1 serine/threonine protein phosphatase [Rhizobium sp. L245/93]MBO9183089.1 serine/threonine protein phosphatase [Rhizobium sp. E27B/91]MBO9134267.1 serine/threonine protein phosphatase [Rhizobium sp. B209b/85]QXZ83447.1 serine/threonine protein phosphatase [Rhizobium sp. K1/93]